MKEHFRRTFMEHVYPLYHSAALPPFKLADKELEDVRYLPKCVKHLSVNINMYEYL